MALAPEGPALHQLLRLLPPAAALFLIAAVPTSLLAQASKPEATPTIAVNARLVTVPVVVRDKKGAILNSLTQSDFAINVDGKPQPIRYFDHDSNLPLTLGLLVDTSGSVSSVLDEERSASSAFLDTMLTNSKDRAFVIQFAHSAELLQDLTSSRPLLQAALKEIDTEPPDTAGSPDNSGNDPDNSGSGPSHHRLRGGGGTVLYDAAFLAGDELMRKQAGHKALVLLTDGEDRGSRESIASAIEAVQRADTTVYAIYFKGEEHPAGNRGGGFPGGGGRGGGIGFPGGGYPGGRGGNGGQRPGTDGGEPRVDGKKILERITGETGGRVFEESKKHNFTEIYGEIAEELRSQYRLGFTPSDQAAADGYHQIDVSVVNAKNDYVQTRDGYYTGARQVTRSTRRAGHTGRASPAEALRMAGARPRRRVPSCFPFRLPPARRSLPCCSPRPTASVTTGRRTTPTRPLSTSTAGMPSTPFF